MVAYHWSNYSLPQYSITALKRWLGEGRISTTDNLVKRGRRARLYPIILDDEKEIPFKANVQGDYPTLLAVDEVGEPLSIYFRYGAMKLAVEKGNSTLLMLESLNVLEKELSIPPTRSLPESGLSGGGSPSGRNTD